MVAYLIIALGDCTGDLWRFGDFLWTDEGDLRLIGEDELHPFDEGDPRRKGEGDLPRAGIGDLRLTGDGDLCLGDGDLR